MANPEDYFVAKLPIATERERKLREQLIEIERKSSAVIKATIGVYEQIADLQKKTDSKTADLRRRLEVLKSKNFVPR